MQSAGCGKRNVRREDIVECGRTALEIRHDANRGTYKLMGYDLDHVELTIVLGISDNVVAVTVY